MQLWEKTYKKGGKKENSLSYWKMDYLELPEEKGKFSVRKKYNFMACGRENKKQIGFEIT